MLIYRFGCQTSKEVIEKNKFVKIKFMRFYRCKLLLFIFLVAIFPFHNDRIRNYVPMEVYESCNERNHIYIIYLTNLLFYYMRNIFFYLFAIFFYHLKKTPTSSI